MAGLQTESPSGTVRTPATAREMNKEHGWNYAVIIAVLSVLFTVGSCAALETPTSLLESVPAKATPDIAPTQEIIKANIIHHPRPELSVDWDEFPSTGCIEHDSFRYCLDEPNDLSDVFMCSTDIWDRNWMFGGLNPSYPTAICGNASIRGNDPKAYLYMDFSHGCDIGEFVHYMVYDGEQYQIIASKNDLKRLFAPIETSEEALSYVLAATGLHVSYDGVKGHVTPQHYRYFVTEFEDTHVVEVEDGYSMNLFESQNCGCGPLKTFEIEFYVSNNGDIERLSKRKIYENVNMSACYD